MMGFSPDRMRGYLEKPEIHCRFLKAIGLTGVCFDTGDGAKERSRVVIVMVVV